MAIATGRAGVITPRDEELMEGLMIARYQVSRQIATIHFNSETRCRARLYELFHKGYLKYRHVYTTAPAGKSPGKREAVWHLDKEAFEMIAGSLGYDDERWAPKQLSHFNTRHYVKTNDLYAAVRNDLNSILDRDGEWLWEHAGRVEDHYEYRAEPFVHKPDAHLSFGGRLYIIERQTQESRVTAEKIKDKIWDHKQYATVILRRTPEQVKVLVACDEQRVSDAAKRAGDEYGIQVAAGPLEKITDHVLDEARSG